jgi:putative DNA methylase
LAAEVRYWGQWVLEKVKAEIGDLYPPIPDPAVPLGRERMRKWQTEFATEGFEQRGQMEFFKDLPGGYLTPVAYLWTRTVTCKNPSCRATVPLVRQTWLCKKKDQYVALKMIAAKGEKRIRFELVESPTEKGLGFDPAGFSKAGNATCPFCGTVADNDYVKDEGRAGCIGTQPMALCCVRRGARGKIYFAADELERGLLPDDAACRQRIEELCRRAGLTVPNEPIVNDAKNANFCMLYGLDRFSKLFTPRQMLSLLTFAAAVCDAHRMMSAGCPERAAAVAPMLACVVDKQADFNSTLCVLKADGGRGIVHTFGRQALPMVWDFAEANPLNEDIASWASSEAEVFNNIRSLVGDRVAVVERGSSSSVRWPDNSLDALITDPPYYDNVPYADISDFFYVWLKRTVGHLYLDHFSGEATPKRQEAVADATRHGGDRKKAVLAYENMMAQSLAEAQRVLKPDGTLVVVYAHKTTVGWSTLVDAFRRAGFMVTEAWPLDTETTGRLRAQESAVLASSIFLIGRKRSERSVGSYESVVCSELTAIVRERVATLWDQGISGADLVIACVGAGLRAFTRFARVEYANGEEVPAERFLSEVETVVLETILTRLSREVGGNEGAFNLAALDAASRFYVLWRYTYKAAELDAGEAIVFAHGTHVELDGPAGLSAGADAILQKKKGKYRLRDFAERGDDHDLGIPSADARPAPVIDALHRTLWLMENRPAELPQFLREAQPNREQMRLVAQALAGPGLKGGELADVSPSVEQAALAKLTANWRSVVEDAVTTAAERTDQKRGQRRMFES